GRDLQFLVAVAQRLEALAQVQALGHGGAQAGAGAVAAEQGLETDLVGGTVVVVDEAGDAGLEVHFQQAPVEVDAGAGRLGGIEHGQVEAAEGQPPDRRAGVAALAQQTGWTMRPGIMMAWAITVSARSAWRSACRPRSARARLIERPPS